MSNALVPITGAGGSSELAQLVSFSICNEEYGVEVLKVREIIRMTTITHMPNTPPYVEGVINLRGKVIPIMSMRKRFGLAETANDSQTRIIVIDIAGSLTGFIVDSVAEVIRITGSEIQPPPSMTSGGLEQEFIVGVVNRADRMLILLDPDKMLSRTEREYLGEC
ncbi:purine-binding chemotaxis protein CheW [Oryzomonas japonica]|uniref:Purine-binding chemotaxis protein CheW n=1 Tax=Oryzomonas japonica TaxID=2603858 RepID=A0A7J4ZSD8_9BACT|nr:chemotaxis protein CheW [Oryzomonas japonica]KAB0666011.1 purine-binding chemotaxis protein CheW [Oryzomonas japonica]